MEGIRHIFIDCDDCLYQNNWATANKITKSIAAYTLKLGVDEKQAYHLYKTHGTCLKGLLLEGIIDRAGVEDFLLKVHDIDYDDIAPDPALVEVLARLMKVAPCWVFTASAREHAQRCLARVGLDTLPWQGIIDTRDCDLQTKHVASSFHVAMKKAGATDPSTCLFFDDSKKNVCAAKALGWTTVLVGLYDRDTGDRIYCDEADFHIPHLAAFDQQLLAN